MSACVSGPLDRAATSGIGTSAAVPNGAASCTACELGALAGRNLVLLFCVTLFSEGSSDAAAIAPATHAISTSQRNLTAREPIALKMVSICTRRSLRGEPDKTLLGGCRRVHANFVGEQDRLWGPAGQAAGVWLRGARQIWSSGLLASWQRSVVMASAPAVVQCMPDNLRRCPMTD